MRRSTSWVGLVAAFASWTSVAVADPSTPIDQVDRGAVRTARADKPTTLHVETTSGDLTLELERFRVTTPKTRFVLGRLGGADEPLAFDPEQVLLLRGHVRGRPDSRALVVRSGEGGRGYVEIDGRRHALTVPALDGDAPDPERLRARVIESRSSLPPDLPLCGVHGAPMAPLRVPPSPAEADGVPGATTGVRVIELAIETDYEYFSLHEDAAAASAYILSLFGAISDIYERDLDMRIEITFVRIWNDPMDLFNEPNPLAPFQTFWEYNMTDVHRDAAQLVSGRRDFSYGGIAYLDALCTENAYSVVGYVRGFFPDPSGPDPWHYDISVAAHELGHNAGARHTHDYGLDECNLEEGPPQRGTIMSYCSQTRSGGNANTDLRFHTSIQQAIDAYVDTTECLEIDCSPNDCDDCNGNGVPDATDIASGASLDLDANGVPDDCQENCNGNLFPDSYDIAVGISIDAHANGIPDECEADCDDNGVSDYTQIMADMSLDINRNAILDSCEDCDDDMVLDLDALAGAHNLWIASVEDGSVREFHARTGVSMGVAQAGIVSNPRDVVTRYPGRIFVVSADDARVAEFDRFGTFVGDFVTAGSGGLSDPTCMAFSHVTGHLYVVSRGTNSVLEYHGQTGEFLRVFVAPGSGGLVLPFGLAFGVGGELYVTSETNRVLEYDPISGAFARTLVDVDDNGGLASPRGMVLNTDRSLLVASFDTDQILRYDRLTGDFLGQFNIGGSSTVLTLDDPWCIRIGPDDNVYVSRNGAHAHTHDDPSQLHLTGTRIYMFDWETGLYMRSIVSGEDSVLYEPAGFDFFPDITEDDCNRNGLPDSCDIANGTSLDTNLNDFPDECECHADVDQDGEVGFSDLLVVINEWGICPLGGQCPPDVDGNGIVNFGDIVAMIGQWGPCF
ncbi:MAG: M12 family metallo-peptidase [Planctomycetota bacterium]|jgi:hypothetical protein